MQFLPDVGRARPRASASCPEGVGRSSACAGAFFRGRRGDNHRALIVGDMARGREDAPSLEFHRLGQLEDSRPVEPPKQVDHPRQLGAFPGNARLIVFAGAIWIGEGLCSSKRSQPRRIDRLDGIFPPRVDRDSFPAGCGWCSGPSAPIAARRLGGRATTALGAVSGASARPGSTGCGRSTNSVRARRRWPVRHSHVWCAASRWRRPARLAGFAPTPVGRRRTGRFDAVTLNA